MRRAYATSTRVMSGIIMLLGVTMVISALARGGGALALGVVLGHDAGAARRRPALARPRRGAVSGGGGAGGRAREALRHRSEGLRRGSERAGAMISHTLGEPALFAITLSSVVAAIFFSLGVVAGRALGLTPLVFLLAGIFFAVTMATYVEGSSLHIERGGASTFARYAFDEFWSFVAGWAILLDYLIVMAIGAVVISEYLTVFWNELDEGVLPES